MLSLLDIETEVITIILEYVHDSSPKTTKAVACVNRYLNHLTQSVGHRHKNLYLEGVWNEQAPVVGLIRSWISDQFVLSNIRTLTIGGTLYGSPPFADEGVDAHEDNNSDEDEDTLESPVRPVQEADVWSPLVLLISRISKLYQFSWNVEVPLPLPVLEALERNQKASSLRIFKFMRSSPRAEELSACEARLARSPALTHIRHVCRPLGSWPDLQEAAFRSIVASAPNLEYAGLLLNQPPLDLSNDEHARFERLRKVFDPTTKPSTSVKQLTLDGVEISKKTLDDWSATIDLASLQNVKFSRGVPTLDYFQYAANALPNLKHLSLNLRTIQEKVESPERIALVTAVQEYIRECAPLESLSLWSWIEIIPLSDILQRHGATLVSLQLHERETIKGRSVLSIDGIESIRHSCPRLRSFTFDIQRHHPHLTWDNDPNKPYYEEISRFEHLNTLQIYFDFGLQYVMDQDGPGASRPLMGYPDYDFDAQSDLDESASDGSNRPTTTMPMSATPQSDSSSSPPSKIPRLATAPAIRPSRDKYLTAYVQKIWHHVFDRRSAGPRHLDVKVGEWESRYHGWSAVEHKLIKYITVRPNERDDVLEPTVHVNKRKPGRWNE